MDKSVLAISANPRKGGDSDTPYDESIRRAQGPENHAEKIFPASKNTKYCIGYDVCNTTQKCVQKDDIAGILDKMVEVDVIASATPAYFYIMDAQMKTLIDRAVPRYTEIQNKDFYFIVVAAGTERKMMERITEGFRGFMQDCLTGAKEKEIIYGTGAQQIGEVRGTSAMKQVYEMGRNVQLENKMHDEPEGVSCIFCVPQL